MKVCITRKKIVEARSALGMAEEGLGGEDDEGLAEWKTDLASEEDDIA